MLRKIEASLQHQNLSSWGVCSPQAFNLSKLLKYHKNSGLEAIFLKICVSVYIEKFSNSISIVFCLLFFFPKNKT